MQLPRARVNLFHKNETIGPFFGLYFVRRYLSRLCCEKLRCESACLPQSPPDMPYQGKQGRERKRHKDRSRTRRAPPRPAIRRPPYQTRAGGGSHLVIPHLPDTARMTAESSAPLAPSGILGEENPAGRIAGKIAGRIARPERETWALT